jgi:hypothetical protein
MEDDGGFAQQILDNSLPPILNNRPMAPKRITYTKKK